MKTLHWILPTGLLLSAASDSEAGADISTPLALQEAPTLDGKYHGAFTDGLLRLLAGQLLPGSFNYAQAQVALSHFLEGRHFAQHPQLLPAIAEDPQNVGASAFLAAPASVTSAGGTSTPASAQATPAGPALVHVRLDSASTALRKKIAGLPGVEIVTSSPDLIVRQQADQVRLLGPADDPILTTTAKDPALLHRIAAQTWLKRALPTDAGHMGLRAEANPGSRGGTYVQCETFYFDVRLEKPGYVMVLDLDSHGDLTVLYPTRPAEREAVTAGKPRAIPGSAAGQKIEARAPFGTDEVAVLAFERMPAFFGEQTDASPFDFQSARAASLERGLIAARAGTTGAVGVQQIAIHTYPGRAGTFCPRPQGLSEGFK